MGEEEIVYMIRIGEGYGSDFLIDGTGIVFHTKYKEIAIVQARYEAKRLDRPVIVTTMKPTRTEPTIEFDALRVFPDQSLENGVLNGEKAL